MKQQKTVKKSTKPKWGQQVNGMRHYPLHFFQDKALNSNARITFCFAGTGGGKSCIIPLWILKQLSDQPAKSRIQVVSPTYKIFKQSKLLDAFHEAIEGTELQGTFHKTDNIYTCSNKSEVFFRSAEIADSLEGGQYNALALDEVAKISSDAWIKAQARVGQLQGPILAVTTPDVNSWIYTDIFTKADKLIYNSDEGTIKQSEDKALLCLQWQSTVNPTYSIKELAEQKKKLHPSIFARRYLGQFTKLEGLVYSEFAKCVIPFANIQPSPSVRIVAGVDWGWTDPTSVIVAIEAQDGKVYIVDEIYQSHLPLDQLAETLHALKSKWLIDTFFCDHSRPEIADQLRKTGLNCKTKSVNSIETGIAIVDSRIRNNYICIFDSLVNLINESNIYARKSDKDNILSEKPIDKNNHLMDALRYAVTGLDFGRKLTFEKFDDEDKSSLIAAQVRLAIQPEDAEKQKELQAQKINQERVARFYEMAFGDQDD